MFTKLHCLLCFVLFCHFCRGGFGGRGIVQWLIEKCGLVSVLMACKQVCRASNQHGFSIFLFLPFPPLHHGDDGKQPFQQYVRKQEHPSKVNISISASLQINYEAEGNKALKAMIIIFLLYQMHAYFLKLFTRIILFVNRNLIGGAQAWLILVRLCQN